MRLNIKAFALTCGLVWGFAIFLLTWWVMLLWGVQGPMTRIGMVYIGYSLTPIGSIVGLVWGFFDGLIGGAIFAWIYNLISGRLGSSAGA